MIKNDWCDAVPIQNINKPICIVLAYIQIRNRFEFNGLSIFFIIDALRTYLCTFLFLQDGHLISVIKFQKTFNIILLYLIAFNNNGIHNVSYLINILNNSAAHQYTDYRLIWFLWFYALLVWFLTSFVLLTICCIKNMCYVMNVVSLFLNSNVGYILNWFFVVKYFVLLIFLYPKV